jgi:hypothetical protein
MSITWFPVLLHNKVEDTLYACYQDALRAKSTLGQTITCINDDKRKRERNLLTPIPSTEGVYNAEHERFDEGSQPDGSTVYKGYLDRELFRIIRKGMVPNPNQNWNSLSRRVEALSLFLLIAINMTSKLSFGMSIFVKDRLNNCR